MLAQNPNLTKLATTLRLNILEMLKNNGGHIGGSLSSLDLLVALYFGKIFNFPKRYDFTHDCFVLSAGHLAPALYTVLARYGSFSEKNLKTYSQFGSILQGHVSTQVPGVLYSAGSLGQGLSFASGLALSNPKHHVVCLTSDGEHQEGQIWEAAAFANKYHLNNLINIVDYNKYQIDGSTDSIMPLEDLGSKYLRFGWSVYELNGHNFQDILKTLKKAKESQVAPICLIAHTTLGKGISYMHYDYRYHDIKKLDEKYYFLAKSELESQL